MGGRSHRQQIHDHRFVKTSQPVADVPYKVRRPVPVQRFPLWAFLVPIPLDFFPQFGDAREQFGSPRISFVRIAILLVPVIISELLPGS